MSRSLQDAQLTLVAAMKRRHSRVQKVEEAEEEAPVEKHAAADESEREEEEEVDENGEMQDAEDGAETSDAVIERDHGSAAADEGGSGEAAEDGDDAADSEAAEAAKTDSASEQPNPALIPSKKKQHKPGVVRCVISVCSSLRCSACGVICDSICVDMD